MWKVLFSVTAGIDYQYLHLYKHLQTLLVWLDIFQCRFKTKPNMACELHKQRRPPRSINPWSLISFSEGKQPAVGGRGSCVNHETAAGVVRFEMDRLHGSWGYFWVLVSFKPHQYLNKHHQHVQTQMPRSPTAIMCQCWQSLTFETAFQEGRWKCFREIWLWSIWKDQVGQCESFKWHFPV